MSIRDLLGQLGEGTKAASSGKAVDKKDEVPPRVGAIREIYCDQHGTVLKKYEAVAGALPSLDHGHAYHIVHHGGWATEHLLARIAELCGPMHLRAATWAVSDDACLRLADAQGKGLYLSGRFILDRRMALYRPVGMDVLASAYGLDAIRILENHAKAYWLENDEWSFTLIGSMNLTDNPRIEIMALTEGREIGDFWHEWFDSTFGRAKPLHADQDGWKAKREHTTGTVAGELIVLRGLPGSGKTTWLREHHPDLAPPALISHNDFFTHPITGAFKYEAARAPGFHKQAHFLLREAIHFRAPLIVIDNTHAKTTSFRSAVARAESAGYKVRVLRFDAPVEFAIARNVHDVPEETIREMATAFEPYEGEEVIPCQ